MWLSEKITQLETVGMRKYRNIAVIKTFEAINKEHNY